MNRHLRYLGAVAGVGAMYWLAAKAELQLAYLHGSVAALCPPVGVGMAALILWGLRLWPGIALGEIAVLNFVQPAGTILGQAVGNTLEVVIAALLFSRLADGRTQFGRVRDVGALVIAAAAGTAVSATFGAVSLRLGGYPYRCDNPAPGTRGRCNRDADRGTRAASLPTGRALCRVSGPDLGGASRRAAGGGGSGGASHHADDLQHCSS
jgi:hypothetical protein